MRFYEQNFESGHFLQALPFFFHFLQHFFFVLNLIIAISTVDSHYDDCQSRVG